MTIPTLNALPSLPLAEVKRLPACHAIYFVRSSDGAMLYVGKAVNLRQRWASHHRTGQLAAYPDVSIAWLEVSDRALLDEIEQGCIAHFRPVLNETKVQGGTSAIGLRLNDTDRAMLDALMARYGWNDQDMLRQLIREGYARMDAQTTPRSVTTAPADETQGFD